MKKIFTAFLLVFVISSFTYSQNLENRVNKYKADFGNGYAQPLVEALGLNMNNGWVSVKSMKDLFSIDVGISAVFVPVPSSDKSFLIVSPYNPSVLESVSTAVGPAINKEMSGVGAYPNADPKNYPNGFDIGLIPVVMPQASIGNLINTRLTIRALPKIKINDIGYISLFGVGLQHNISADLVLPMPVDFGILGSYENLQLGDIASANSYTISALVSKRVWKINFYSLLGYDYTKFKFSYTSTFYDFSTNSTKTLPVAFENEGRNGFKLSVGGTAETRFARFNAGMNFLPKFCFDLGLSVGFGLKKLL